MFAGWLLGLWCMLVIVTYCVKWCSVNSVVMILSLFIRWCYLRVVLVLVVLLYGYWLCVLTVVCVSCGVFSGLGCCDFGFEVRVGMLARLAAVLVGFLAGFGVTVLWCGWVYRGFGLLVGGELLVGWDVIWCRFRVWFGISWALSTCVGCCGIDFVIWVWTFGAAGFVCSVLVAGLWFGGLVVFGLGLGVFLLVAAFGFVWNSGFLFCVVCVRLFDALCGLC